MNATGSQSGASKGSDAWNSPIEMGDRDAPHSEPHFASAAKPCERLVNTKEWSAQ